jgi:DNA-binding response OmpR family regulator
VAGGAAAGRAPLHHADVSGSTRARKEFARAAAVTRTVLVVEDEPDTREMLRDFLELGGFAVATAANGRDGLVEARRHKPCVILLDLMMPVMSGEQFRKVQMTESGIRHIPVVVLSARHDACRIAEIIRAADCITKPLDMDRLIEVVDKQCSEPH